METPPSLARLGQLRRRFHELGATNPYAVEEYAELRQRLETLETQGADLRTAIARTRELIAELETMITDQFQTTFRALEAAFAARFEQLFGGGFARLSLTDPSDLGSTGVEIVARPPGKKAQALAMLSGGERALTAVALLFAMLEVRPVPFCVLDEVDAALDEANIGRFADALRSLAHQTQFIVITHNRGTIEAADALYGVTVGRRLGEPGHQPPARRGPGARGATPRRAGDGRLMAFWRRRRDAPAESESVESPETVPSPEDVGPGWEPDPADFGDDVALVEPPAAPETPLEPVAEPVAPSAVIEPAGARGGRPGPRRLARRRSRTDTRRVHGPPPGRHRWR